MELQEVLEQLRETLEEGGVEEMDRVTEPFL